MRKASISARFVTAAELLARQLVDRHVVCSWPAAVAALTLLASLPLRSAGVTEVWVHRYSNIVSNSLDQAFKIVSDAAGDIIVAGISDNGITGKDFLTTKYSGSDGSVLWQNRYRGPDKLEDRISGLALDGSGNVLVMGISAFFGEWGPGNGDYYTAKYAAADGAILWENRRPKGVETFSGNVEALLAVDRRGDVVVSMPGLTTPDGVTHAFITKYGTASGNVLWEKRYESPFHGSDWLNCLTVDANGNVFAAGRSDVPDNPSKFYVAKYSTDGDVIWEKHSIQLDVSDPSVPKPVAVDGSGNLVVVSHLENSTIQTRKYSGTDGAVLWTKRYEKPGNGDYTPTALAVDSNSDVIITGMAYVAKYASGDGALLWEKLGKSTTAARALAVDLDNNIIIAEKVSDVNYVVKYRGSDGGLIWAKNFDLPGDFSYEGITSVATDGNANIYVSGSDNSYGIVKYEPVHGTVVWNSRQNGPANHNDYATAVVVDVGGNVIVTGISEKDYGRMQYTAKYAYDGALLWSQAHHAGFDESQAAVVLDRSGDVITSSGEHTAKYAAANGMRLWEQRSSNYFAVAVAVDESGNAVTTGYVSSTNRLDYYTAKYAAIDGAVLWERFYSTGSDDVPAALTLDSHGNVLVTGTSGDHLYTVKYAAADGALLWERRYSQTSGRADEARAVAVDARDNVVVTGRSLIGYSQGTGSAYDFYTAKYAAANGAVLWQRSYDGPQHSNDEATGVGIDSQGNVVVTGYSQGDLYTVKYVGTDGALLWEKRMPFGYGRAIIIDSHDNPVVTGTSWNEAGSDYYTAKYRAADGAVLWEGRYNGPANGEDYPTNLGIGPNGIVAVTGASDGNFGPPRSDGGTADFLTIVYRENLSVIAIHKVPSAVRLSFTGIAGQIYSLERGPNVTGPWSTLKTQVTPASGLIQYEDSALASRASFYRMTQP